MKSNAHPLFSTYIGQDAHAIYLEVRIHDGARPWVLAHPLPRYEREGPAATASYLAKRYLVSRPDQLRYASVAAVTALLQTALEEYEAGDGLAMLKR